MLSDDFKKIMYILIGSGKKPLASYSVYKSKSFITITESMLKENKITKELKIIKQDEINIYSQEVNNISYIVLTTDKFSLTAGAGCIESLIKEIGPLLQGRNFNKIKDYGLNDELKEKLKMKFEYFNENPDFISSEHETMKNEITRNRDMLFKASESLNERGNILQYMENKAKILENDSYNYKEASKKFRETECTRKKHIITYIVLGAIILGLIILIIVLALR